MDIPVFPTAVTIASLWVALKIDGSPAWRDTAWPIRAALYALCCVLPSALAWAGWLWYALQQCRS